MKVKDQAGAGVSNPLKSNGQVIQINKALEEKWKNILIVATVISVFFSKYLYEFQNDEAFRQLRKGSVWDLIFQGGYVAIIFTVLDHSSHWLIDDWVFNHYVNPDKFQGIQARKNRSYSISKWIFSNLYYGPISVWAYLLLKETSFMPYWLGGNGNCRNLHIYIENFDEGTEQMKLFYMIQFGKHLSRLFSHLFIKSDGVFYETALHHGLSTFLILYSYLSNMWVIGVMVLFCHDIADFFFRTARVYKEYRYANKNIFLLLSIVGFTIWFGLRIIISLYCTIGAAIEGFIHIHSETFINHLLLKALYWPFIFMMAMLCCLQILQFYWTYIIVLAFIKQQNKFKNS